MSAIIGSVRGELLRLRKWTAVWVVFGAWSALALVFGYVFDYVAYRTGDQGLGSDGKPADLLPGLLPGGVPDVLIQGLPLFGGALALVLGALAAGNGYAWGTWKTSHLQGPSRSATALGSFLALTVLVVGLVVLTLALDLAASLCIALIENAPASLPPVGDLVTSLLAGLLVLEMWAMVGFALGTAARGAALAIGLGLVWTLVVENLLRGVSSLLAPIDALTHALPGTAVGSLVGSLIGAGGGSTPGVLDVLSGGQAALVASAYLVAAVALSAVLILRRDMT